MEEENSERQEKERRSLKERVSRYVLPVVILVSFVVGAFVASSISSTFSGASIADMRTDYQERITNLEAENSNLKTTLSAEGQTQTAEKKSLELEKSSLEGKVTTLQSDINFYEDILSSMDEELVETRYTPFGFKITWDKYISTSPNQQLIWEPEIENRGSVDKTFSPDLRLKSNDYELFENEPVIGSLSLLPKNSGKLSVKLTPKEKGYAIFELYVNNNYIGDLLVLSI